MTKSRIKNFCWSILLLFLILILVFFLIQKKSKELSSNRIALIDSVNDNYIFRGDNPFIIQNGKKVFSYDELTTDFNNILHQQNHILPNSYYLIDVSLLDLDEYSDIRKEQQFFTKNPQRGMFINVSTLSPSLLFSQYPSYSNFITKAVTRNYNIWLTGFLKQIYELASQKTDQPIVIYIHCDGGRDRTGFITASYRLLFNDTNISKARLQNVEEVGRNSREIYDRALHSYCLYLKQTMGKDDNYCQPEQK